jgi:hypothetical protein
MHRLYPTQLDQGSTTEAEEKVRSPSSESYSSDDAAESSPSTPPNTCRLQYQASPQLITPMVINRPTRPVNIQYSSPSYYTPSHRGQQSWNHLPPVHFPNKHPVQRQADYSDALPVRL